MNRLKKLNYFRKERRHFTDQDKNLTAAILNRTENVIYNRVTPI